jgi:hypothetical protein
MRKSPLVQAQSKKISTSINVPIPEPVTAAAMILSGQEGVAAGIEESNTNQTIMSYHHEDEEYGQLSSRSYQCNFRRNLCLSVTCQREFLCMIWLILRMEESETKADQLGRYCPRTPQKYLS